MLALHVVRRRARAVAARPPGIARTGLVAHSPAGAIMRLGFLLHDAERGALPALYAATPDVAGNAYVGPDGLGSVKGHPKDPEALEGRTRS